MKVYLSGSFDARDQIEEYAGALRGGGVQIVSSWLAEPPLRHDDPSGHAWELRARAHEDIEDVNRCDILVLFTQWPSTSGGRDREAGMMQQRHHNGDAVRMIIVGELSNIFDRPLWIERVDTFDDLFAQLTAELWGAPLESPL